MSTTAPKEISLEITSGAPRFSSLIPASALSNATPG